MLVNTTLSQDEKVSLGTAYGLDSSSTPSTCNGCSLPTIISGPVDVSCESYIWSHDEQFSPLFHMGKVRLLFKSDQCANFISYNTQITNPSFTITNFQVFYTAFVPSAEVKQSILFHPTILIKSRSVSVTGSNLTSGFHRISI
jgi:hypothetical protein